MTALMLEELGIAPEATDAEKEEKLLQIASDMYGVTPAEMKRRNEARLGPTSELGETVPIIDKPAHFPQARASDANIGPAHPHHKYT